MGADERPWLPPQKDTFAPRWRTSEKAVVESSAPTHVVWEQGLLQRLGPGSPRGVVCEPQRHQPTGLAEGVEPEQPELWKRDRRFE